MTSTCNTCIYMHRISAESGQCKRYAPISTIENKGAKNIFPWVMTLVDWCGDYSGNTQPLTGTEALVDARKTEPVISIKPTPYHKDQQP